MPEVNWIAIVVAAVGSFVLGGLWYSPVLFGKAWQREAGLTDEKLTRPVGIVHRKRRSLSLPARAFVELLVREMGAAA